MHLNEEKLLKCDLKGKTCSKWANGLRIYVPENNGTSGVGLPPVRGNIHVRNTFLSETA